MMSVFGGSEGLCFDFDSKRSSNDCSMRTVSTRARRARLSNSAGVGSLYGSLAGGNGTLSVELRKGSEAVLVGLSWGKLVDAIFSSLGMSILYYVDAICGFMGVGIAYGTGGFGS